MGLHMLDMSMSELSPEGIQERHHLLHYLYCLDKELSWSHGWPPSLPSFEIANPIPTTQTSGEMAAYLSTKLALAQMQEQLYSSLHVTANATFQSHESMSKSELDSFRHMLEEWKETHDIDDRDIEDATPFALCSRLELAISFYSTRIRLLGPMTKQPVISRHLLGDTRTCLNLLQRWWNATPEQGHYASFARYLPLL
jgi:hypothetical protein